MIKTTSPSEAPSLHSHSVQKGIMRTKIVCTQTGGAAVEAHLRPTLRITVLRVDLQGAHPGPDEEDREHRTEVDSVPGEDEGALKLRDERRPAAELNGRLAYRHEEVHREEHR